MSFTIRCRSVFLTYPQCSITKEELFLKLSAIIEKKDLSISEHIVAHELHSDGNPHLHAYLHFSGELYVTKSARFFDVEGNHPNVVTAVRDPKRVIKYCAKEGDYITNMVLDKWKKTSKSDMGRDIMSGKKSLTDITNENPAELFRFKSNADAINRWKLENQETVTLGHEPGYWFGGLAGTGKSYYARQYAKVLAPGEEPYIKDVRTDWWDGYKGQRVVICDDVDRWSKGLFAQVKNLVDPYECQVPCKGGYLRIRPEYILFTSNFTVDEWATQHGIENTDQSLEPYRRRFRLREYWWTSREDQPKI